MRRFLTLLALCACCLSSLAQNTKEKTWWQRIRESAEQKQKTEMMSKEDQAKVQEAFLPEMVDTTIGKPKVVVDSINFTLLLPFGAESKPNSLCFNFYSGVLMAMAAAGEDNIAVKLNVYDSMDGAQGISDEALREADILMGPVSTNDLKHYSARCPGKYFISPLEPGAAVLTDSLNIIQVPLSWKNQISQLAQWACNDTAGADSLIVIKETGARNSDAYGIMVDAITLSGKGCTVISCDVYEDLNSLLDQYLSKGGTSRILLASEKELFSKRVIEVLGKMSGTGLSIATYCPSRIKNFNSISKEDKGRAGVRMISGYHINKSDARSALFESKYQNIFKCKPALFAYQGYDLARYFIRLRHMFGKDWSSHIESIKIKGMQASFDFAKEEGKSGYVNYGSHRLQYSPDGSIIQTAEPLR